MTDHTHDHTHEHIGDHEHEHEHEHEHHHVSHEGHEHLGDDEHMFVHFKEGKDAFMQEHPQSPIPEGKREGFKGLSYYPYNPDLHFHATLDRNVSDEPITMDTSTGDHTHLHRVGKITFEVDGQPTELTIYSDEDGDLFLPLRDATSGKETYGAGRYLDLEYEEDGSVDIDFNYLYNPYCAYNEAYSCPLPPMENWLRVPLQAGEKKYEG